MLYAILCYHKEDVVTSWTKEEDDQVMERLGVVHQKLRDEGKLGPAVRLLPTAHATTLRKDPETPLVIDGPFAETKEQLLGFYVIEGESPEGVLDIARDLARANPGGSYEIRPVSLYLPGTL